MLLCSEMRVRFDHINVCLRTHNYSPDPFVVFYRSNKSHQNDLEVEINELKTFETILRVQMILQIERYGVHSRGLIKLQKLWELWMLLHAMRICSMESVIILL